jgi:hypothetical protein
MYHTWGQEPLWPLPVAPALPVSDTAYRVIAELSGAWEGGTVPGLYAKPNWQLSKEIPIPDSAWLYLPYLIGEVTIYVGERLWSVGEEKAWIPLLGPGVVRITLKGRGQGGILGGAYLIARKGAVAWPLSPSPNKYQLPSLSAMKSTHQPAETALPFWRRVIAPYTWPKWLWAVGMLWWGAVTFGSYPIREAHWRGPWTTTPPHPLENVLGFSLVLLFIFMIGGGDLPAFFLIATLLIEGLSCLGLRCPIEKIWQSWVPVLVVAWVLSHELPSQWVWWGAWGARTLVITFYVPRLVYLCTGSLFVYLLIFS